MRTAAAELRSPIVSTTSPATAPAERPAPSSLPSIFAPLPTTATRAAPATHSRQLAFRSSLLAIPAAAGIGWALRSRRTGVVAGGLAALALGALRWQMARWFTDTSAYALDAQIGDLEIRSYPSQLEARAELEAASFEDALDLGFGRLACYVYGANATDEDISMALPVILGMHDGTYSMSLVMPPGRTMSTLPQPDDSRVAIRERPHRRVAVLRFAGRFSRENVGLHEQKLLQQVVDAGLATRGSIEFASYDSPATLPFLRRNEVWLELV